MWRCTSVFDGSVGFIFKVEDLCFALKKDAAEY
jgi:hypothetical protein